MTRKRIDWAQRRALWRLAEELERAYTDLTLEMRAIGRDPKGRPQLPDTERVRQLMRCAGARCGAAIAAAVKRAKRRYLFDGLWEARRAGLDITPAVAQGTARRLLGRGLDARATAALFARPGRTAADKSSIKARDLAGDECRLASGMSELLAEIWWERERAAARWHASPGRTAVLADWSMQRAEEAAFWKLITAGGARSEPNRG